MRTLILLLLLSFFAITLPGQTDNAEKPLYVRMLNDTTVKNFYEIKKEFNNYFTNRPKGRGTGYIQFRRLQEQWESAFYPSGNMFNISARTTEEYQNYINSFDYAILPANYDGGNWISMGPTNHILGNGWNGGIGRVNCIAFHPSDAAVYFAGTPAGGLWKFSNTWKPLTDGFPSIGISGIVIDPTDANHLFVLTGDGDGCYTLSIGVLESNDGGVSWQTTGLSWSVSDEVRGYKLIINPQNPDILLCATDHGVYKTGNGGGNWSRVLNVNATDVEFKPGDPTIIYAVSRTRFYRSANTGENWNAIASNLPLAGSLRIGIGVTPANPSYVYLVYGRSGNVRSGFMGCYRSVNSGVDFNLRSTTPNIFGYYVTRSDSAEQATYDLSVAVSPVDADEIHFGGINCWKSTDGGVLWNHTSYWEEGTAGEEYTHADIHALEFNPLNNYLFCGSDGGVYRSTDFAVNWTDRSSGLAITQSYRMGGTPQNVNLIATGTQDNGGNTFRGGSVNTFIHDIGADAFESLIDPSDSNIRYESTYSTLYRTTNNGSTWSTSITPGWANNKDLWDVAFAMHPSTRTTLYLGSNDLWKSVNSGSNWTNMGTGNNSGDVFRHIAHGINNLNRIYGQTKLGVYMTGNGGSSWTNVTAGLPVDSCMLSYIAVDPANSAHVYVTCYGYIAGKKVFESTDSGANWNNISGTLPNVQIRCIVYETGTSNGLYIGTDVGVFYKDDSMNDWVPYFTGLPNTIITEMEINYSSRLLVAATFGRGFWKTNLYGECPVSLALTPANNPGPTTQYYTASDHITSTRVVNASFNSTVTYQGGNYITLLPGFEAESGAVFEGKIGNCASVNGNQPSSPIFSRRTTGLLLPGIKK